MRLIITGASGFLGSHIIHQADHENTLGIVNNMMPQDGLNYLQLNLTRHKDVRRLLEKWQPKCLIHTAAKSNLDWCEQNPEEALAVNAEASINLARICSDIGCRFIFISSDMVFDGLTGHYAETDKVNPTALYGESKCEAEKGVLAAHPGAAILRTALIYGQPVLPGRGSSFLMWVLNRLNAGQGVPLYYDQFRTPVEVTQLAKTITKISQQSFSGILHIGGSEKIDRLTFGRYVCTAFGCDASLLERTSLSADKSQAQRPRDLSLNTDKLKEVIGEKLDGCLLALERLSHTQQPGM